MKRRFMFRTRILLVVVTLAVFPLVLTGLWLTRSAARSGEELLQSRLEEYLDQLASRVTANWVRQRSDLLFLAEAPDVQRALQDGMRVENQETPARLQRIFENLDPEVARAIIHGNDARPLWRLEQASASSHESLLIVDLPIHQRFPAARLGDLEVQLGIGALLGDAAVTPTVAGVVLAAFDGERDTLLLPLPFNPSLLDEPRFMWGGEEWIATTRLIKQPPLRLVAAAPLSPFTVPFDAAARRGTWWLAVVALFGLLSAALITGKLTRRLERLATAAEAVSQGDLDAHLDEGGPDETSRVARAFNTMTASLRRMLDELAAREKLAAVGEFAASLAHEVRNPLTAIRLNLQQVEEALPEDSPLRESQSRALLEIVRLDSTVTEALTAAKLHPRAQKTFNLRIPLQAAADTAEPAFRARRAMLERNGLADVDVFGDPRSLEQLFLNLLLNAAAALGPGRRAWLEIREEEHEAIVEIHDAGTGIPEEVLPRVFDPLYSTRAEGTGLGLTVARRIVHDHHGSIEIESEVGKGTTVRVHLPLARNVTL